MAHRCTVRQHDVSQAASQRQRRHLNFDALIQLARRRFKKVPDQHRCPDFPLSDTLMAGLALFSLKDPSLLAFQRRAKDHNLRSVFGLNAIPSDTRMRTILDEVGPEHLRPLFKGIFREVQRGKVLEDYVYLDGCYLIALDGVEYFNSEKIHCPHCMTRHHQNGKVSYYHQMLGAVIVHPELSVAPFTGDCWARMMSHRRTDATSPTRVHRRNVATPLSSRPRTPTRRGKPLARAAHEAAGVGSGSKQMPLANGADRR